MSGDLSLEGQHRDNGPGAGAAGVGEVLHAPLEGVLIDLVLPGELVEIHIGPLGEGGVPAEPAAQLPQLALIRLPQAGEGHRRVGQAGAAQLHVGTGIGDAVHLHGAVQADGGGVVEADPVAAAVNPLPRHHSGGGLHPLDLSGETRLIAVAADAAGAVAAHLPHGAVGVEEQHPVISALDGGLHHHEAVGPDGEMPLAQCPGQPGEVLRREALLQVVQNEKVVARAVHFPEFHKCLRAPVGAQIRMKTSPIPGVRRLSPFSAAVSARVRCFHDNLICPGNPLLSTCFIIIAPGEF